jgi:DNA topoisomerase-1
MAALQIIAGRCTTRFDGSRDQTQYGDVLVIVKPDETVLVHDCDGYQPVAWLTRAETVLVTDESVTAREGDQVLEVDIHETYSRSQVPATEAGIPIADCPECSGTLTRARGTVACSDCDLTFSLPNKANVLDENCTDCGLPRMRVQRGASFEVCLDRSCDSLDDRVRSAFDREWACPDCDGDLRVLRRGGLLLGCDRYPDCETSFSFPTGLHGGECACGLPTFETTNGTRCLDSGCEGQEAENLITGQ